MLGVAPNDPTPTADLAARLRRRGVGNLIVTLGEKGALTLTDEQTTHVPGVAVEVVDTTGAGDTFNAGLAVALPRAGVWWKPLNTPTVPARLPAPGCGVIPALSYRSRVDELYAKTFG